MIPDADAPGWIERRIELHRDPEGPILRQRSSGVWLLINERKTEDGATVAVYTDITERKRIEDQLREKTEYLELNQVITRAANEATTSPSSP